MVVIVYLEASLTITCGIYFLINAILKRHDLINLIEKLKKIDETLKRTYAVLINHTRFNRVSIFFLIIVLVYYNIVVTFVVYSSLDEAIDSINGLIIFMIYIVQAATSGIFTHGFISYAVAIYARVMKLNQKLATIVCYPPELLELKYKTKNDLCMEMMRFTKIYKQLCSCVEDLNRIYGFSLVLHFTHDFTLLTSQIFSMFYVSFYEPWPESQLKIIGLAIWMMPNILKITAICFVCHMTRNEVRKIWEKI